MFMEVTVSKNELEHAIINWEWISLHKTCIHQSYVTKQMYKKRQTGSLNKIVLTFLFVTENFFFQ